MDKIYAAQLPGFYRDERGAYGIVLNSRYICCFVNGEDEKYDVTVDGVDGRGDFALNYEWESYTKPEDAINCLCRMIRKYCLRT